MVGRLGWMLLLAVGMALPACSGDDDKGAGEGEACEVDADCQQGLVCRGQVCIGTTTGGDAANIGNNDAGNVGNNDAGVPVTEEDFRVSYRIAVSLDAEELRVINTATGEEQTVSPPGFDCRTGCWLNEDGSKFLYTRTNTDTPGTVDVFSAPTTTLPVEFCDPVTDCIEAAAVRSVDVVGNTLTYVRSDGTNNVAYFRTLDTTDPEIAIGSLGAVDSTLGDFHLGVESDSVVVYQPTLQTLNVLYGELGMLQDTVDFTVNSQNYQEVSGSYFGGAVLTAFNDDGSRMAFVTQRAPLDSNSCQNESECLGPGARCGRFDRCAFIQVTVHLVDTANIENLGGPCSSDEACGPVHTCDIPSETMIDQATCIPRRVVLGLPAEQTQGNPPQSGCTLTAGNDEFFFTSVSGPLSFDAEGDLVLTANRECAEGNVPYSSILKIDAESGAISEIVGNRSENFFGENCYDFNEMVTTPDSCTLFIDGALAGPAGNKIALLATNPTASDPSLATRLIDLWTVNRDGTDLTWVGQHGQLDAVKNLTVHPLP